MCFSAGASFTASGILFLAFLLSLRKAHGSPIKNLAYIPLFFALQQFTEGIIWLLPLAQSAITSTATYLFLFFALIWWPLFIPAISIFLEKKSLRKYILYPVQIIALFVATIGIALLYWGVSAQIIGCHVSYLFAITSTWSQYNLYRAAYLLATTVPFFVSSIPRMWTLGVGVAAAYGISTWWYQEHLLSVWCFFAAIISCIVLYVIHVNTKQQHSLKNL